MLSHIPLFTSIDVKNQNVATMLIAYVSIAIVSVVCVTILVIILIALFMNDERQKILWNRFEIVREKSRYDIAKRRALSRSPNVQHPTALGDDNDLHQLHSYFLKRRHVGRDDHCDSNRRSHQLDIVSQEVKEWKKIQKDVKMQLTVLNKAVQQLHEKNSQNRVPNLEKVDY
jgi:hypothetical protein